MTRIQSLESTWWKRTNFQKLFFDFHTCVVTYMHSCACTHTHTLKLFLKERRKRIRERDTTSKPGLPHIHHSGGWSRNFVMLRPAWLHSEFQICLITRWHNCLKKMYSSRLQEALLFSNLWVNYRTWGKRPYMLEILDRSPHLFYTGKKKFPENYKLNISYFL